MWNVNYPTKYTQELIEQGLKEVNFDPENDVIYICTGNIFDETRKWFNENGYQYKDAKIEGVLQDKVEMSYLTHLKLIGVQKKISLESGKKRFFELFDWVVEDYPKRRKFVKSGFRKWQTKWEAIARDKYRHRNPHSSHQNSYYQRNYSHPHQSNNGGRSNNPKSRRYNNKSNSYNSRNSKRRNKSNNYSKKY